MPFKMVGGECVDDTPVHKAIREALANCLQPFWMVPLLGIMKLHPKHLVGYGIILFSVMAPLVFALSLLLGMTI